MPTPKFPKPVAGNFASVTNKSIVRVHNETTDEEFFETTNASGKCVIDANNFTSGFTAGDVVRMTISGTRFGSNSIKLTAGNKGPQTLRISTTAESSTLPAISI